MKKIEGRGLPNRGPGTSPAAARPAYPFARLSQRRDHLQPPDQGKKLSVELWPVDDTKIHAAAPDVLYNDDGLCWKP
jgi:hypothetical protein